MEAPLPTGSTAEQLPKATSSPRNDQDSLPRASEGATAIPDTCTPENPSSDSFPSLDQTFGDILRGTSMFFPTRPTNPTIIHTLISILLYPTIFEELYGKTLKTDFIGVTRLIADVGGRWKTNQSTMIRCIFAQVMFHFLFWWKGIKLGPVAWNVAYLSFAGASASLLLMMHMKSKVANPLFYLGEWGFQEFAVLSFFVALPEWLGWMAMASLIYVIWNADPWMVLDVILNALT